MRRRIVDGHAPGTPAERSAVGLPCVGVAVLAVYAGRRPSEEGPLGPSSTAGVDKRLRLLLAGLRPRLVFGSAAAGSDLLVLRAALAAGASARVYTAGQVTSFRRVSVEDKGGEWPALFDSLTGNANVHVAEVGATTDAQCFTEVTRRMREDAELTLAEHEPLVVIVVSEGRRSGSDETEDLATAAVAAGHLVIRIEPQGAGDERHAFVAMPYGIRRIGGGAPDYDADATYYRILAPALIASGLTPIRADLEASLEIIDVKMIRAMGTAPFFVADLALQNPNVFWELGVRHAWVKTGTLLVKPEPGDRPPFDVARVPVVPYRRDAGQVSDADAVWSIGQLLPVLAAPARGCDSPVFQALPGLMSAELPPPEDPDAGAADRLTQWAERLQLAVALRDQAALEQVAEEARATGDEDQVRLPAGFASIQLGLFDSALDLLQPAVEADLTMDLVVLQQQYSLALLKTMAPDNVRKAELRLSLLNEKHPGNAETLGLLGSAAKVGYRLALASDDNPAPHLDRAIEAYRAGAQADPADYFPAVNAVFLLRARAAASPGPNAEQDLAAARELVHVVRFALSRPQVQEGVWSKATRAEIALHDHILGGPSSPKDAHAHYASAAASANYFQLRSMRDQLELCRTLGDPEGVIEPLLRLLA